MIKKSLYLIFILLAVVSCKKNEENFTISEDILTPIISHPGFSNIPDITSPWKGNRLLIRTSNELVATGEKLNVTEHTEKINTREISFAKTNSKHNFSGSTKIEDWLVINNDEIKIESDAFFYEASPTYFDVEITESDYSGYSSIESQLGAELAASINPNFAAFLNLFPNGKIERLRLTMDYNFLSTDKTQRSREYREYHFFRLKPTAGGFLFTTLDKYE